MEPESLPAGRVLGDRIMDGGSIQRFMSQVREHDLEVLDFKRQWEEYEESMREHVKKKEEESEIKQSLEALVMVLVLEEMVEESMTKKHEELLLVEKELKKKEEEFQLKQEAEARDIEVKMNSLEVKEKSFEDLMRELEVRKQEVEAREKEVSLAMTEKCNELKKEEEELEVKKKSLELKEKELEEIMSDLDVRKHELEAREKEQSLTINEKSCELEKRNEKQEAEAKEIEVKRNALELREKQLEEREQLLQHKKRVLDNRKRSRDDDESETSLFADHPLIHTGKKLKGNSDCELYGSTSADLASAKGREMIYIDCIDDEDGDNEDPEPYNCLDADFNNTINSFSVGQVWALYDPSDHMPRYYALIRRILKPQLKVEVTWLEPKQTSEKPLLPIACGEFKYGAKDTSSHLMFSHEMNHIRTGKTSIVINPRKGETWALFRDWKSEQHKRPYSYDFVHIESELDSVHGIGVAYLGKVEGFTSVYKHAPQHDCLKMMIPSDEMLRFSHRVPSFELTLTGEGVPDAGSLELDPAAIPRDYLEAFNVKEEEEESLLGLTLVQV